MLVVVFGAAASVHSAQAQCVPRWWATEVPYATFGMTTWDPDGAGPGGEELVAGVLLPGIPQVGQPTQISRYDGRTWRPVGDRLWGVSLETLVYAFADATTSGIGSPMPGLYVAGKFEDTGVEPARNIARWDGTRWLGLAETIAGYSLYTLAMFDEDGEGPDEPNLFVGGTIESAGSVMKPGIVRWDGTTYSSLGSGLSMTYPSQIPVVQKMLVFDDDGDGPNQPALYVAGGFRYVNGEYAPGVARWTGTAWESLGGGIGAVNDLAIFDADGEGPELPMLYAGGGFSTTDPQGNPFSNVGRWTGTHWEGVPVWNAGGVSALEVFDDDGDEPNGASLVVSGFFTSANGLPARYIVRWDGQNWRVLGSGITSWAEDMCVFDEDGDPKTPDGLYVGGIFGYAGGIRVHGFARWGCPNPVCFADCDDSGALDIFDFLCFQNAFVTADPYACNCDVSTGGGNGAGNGVCDIFDFLCYQNAFVAGCP